MFLFNLSKNHFGKWVETITLRKENNNISSLNEVYTCTQILVEDIYKTKDKLYTQNMDPHFSKVSVLPELKILQEHQSHRWIIHTYISVELPDKAGEVVVLEVLWQKLFSELRHVPDNEAVVPATPRHNLVGQWIINHIVGLAQKRRNRVHHRSRRRRRVRRRYRFTNRSHTYPKSLNPNFKDFF